MAASLVRTNPKTCFGFPFLDFVELRGNQIQKMATDVLSALPVELLTIVVAHLKWKDYAAFRLTCRHIEGAMFSPFARDSFTTCRVMRTPESIQTLIAISKSRLGPFVKHLSISTELLCPSSRNSWPSQSVFGVEMTPNQEAFIFTGCDRDMLTQALVNLQSVQSIQVRPVRSAASYSTSTTPRDPFVKQRSLGLRKILLEQEIAESSARVDRPTRGGDAHSDMACIYSTYLALGKTNLHPTELEFAVKGSFSCKALQIPPCIASSAIPVLGRLKSLVLSVTCRPRSRGVRDLLQYTTQLRALSISFHGLQNRHDGFVEWLASLPPPEAATRDTLLQSPPAVNFNCLRKLQLNGLYGVYVQDLLSVVRKFAPRLEELHFHGTRLETSPQDQGSTSGAPGNLWIEFLKSLDTEPIYKLRQLCIKKVGETNHVVGIHHRHQVPCDVTFAQGLERYVSCAYSGPAMKHALEAMVHYLAGDSSWTPQSQEGKWTFKQGKDEPKEISS